MSDRVPSDPWHIYDEMIEAIDPDVTVTAGTAGLRWCQVTSCEDGVGLAFSIPVQSRPAIFERPSLKGMRLRDVAALVKSWNFAEAGLGLAAINAFYGTPARCADAGFAAHIPNRWDAVFAPYADAVAGKTVAVIGHFPFAPPALDKAAELCVLERAVQPGDYPDPACEYLLPDRDFVFISGSAFVNKTMPRLLDLAADSTVVLVGPSTPLCPALFDHGVDSIVGFTATAPAELTDALGGVTLAGMYDFGRLMERSTMPPMGMDASRPAMAAAAAP